MASQVHLHKQLVTKVLVLQKPRGCRLDLTRERVRLWPIPLQRITVEHRQPELAEVTQAKAGQDRNSNEPSRAADYEREGFPADLEKRGDSSFC